MNKKERLLAALCSESIDRAPLICPGGMMNPVVKELMDVSEIYWPEAHENSEKMAALSRAVVEEGMFENYGVPFCMSVEAEAMGAEVDLGSSLYEPRVSKYPMDKIDELWKLSPMDMKKGRAKTVLDAIAILKNDEVPVVGNVPGPVSIASSLIEPTRFYVALKKNPEAAHALMRFVTEEAGHFALEQVRAGADIITIADPSGTGEILGPKYFKEYMVGYLNDMIKIIRTDKDVPVIVHICGRMNSVFEIISEVDASAFSFDALVSLSEARKYINKPIMGNISTYAIETSNPDSLKRMSKNRLDKGVDIIAPACGLGLASPLVNVRSLLEGICDE